MSQNIGDFEATIRMIMSSPDANKAIADAKALSDAYEKISSRAIGPSASSLLKQQDATFKTTADTLLHTIEKSSTTVLELADRLRSAGIPLTNLNAYAQQLAMTIASSAKALADMNKGFYTPGNAYKQNPFTVQNNGVMNSLVADSNKSLTPLLQNAETAWNAAAKLVQAQKTAVESVGNLLSGQQKLASSLGAVGNTNDPLAQKVRDTETNVNKMKKLVQEYADALRGFGANATMGTTTVSGINAQAAAIANAEAKMRGLASAKVQASAGASKLNAGFADMISKLGQLSMFASGPFASLLGRLSSFSLMPNIGGGTIAAVAGISAATLGLSKFMSESIRVERTVGPVRELFIQLAKVTGEDGKRAFEDTTNTLIKYGLGIDNLIKPMSRLMIATQGTILGGVNFKGFMEDFAAIGSKFALPEEAISGMAKAFEQMLSKGTVQLEELKGQLGDRFPAALRVALLAFREMTDDSKASMGDFFEAVKKGTVNSEVFIDSWMRKTKEVFGITNEATQNLNTSYGRLSGTYTKAIMALDDSIGASKKWMSVIDGLTTSIGYLGNNANTFGPIAAAAFGVTAVSGVMRLLNYFGMVETKLLSMRSKILLVAGAATAMILLSDGAQAGERSVQALTQRATELSQEMDKAGSSFSKWSESGEVLADAQRRFTALKELLPQIREEIDRQKGTWRDGIQTTTGTEIGDKLLKTTKDLLGLKSTGDLENNLKLASDQLNRYKKIIDDLGPKQKAFEADTNSLGAGFDAATKGATANKEAMEGIQSSIAEVTRKYNILKEGGLEGVVAFEGYTEILKKFGIGAKDASKDVIKSAKELADLQKRFDDERKKTEKDQNKVDRLLDGGELSRAEGVIQRAQAIIEGAGLAQGNLIRKNIKELKDYQEALIATGMEYGEAAKKADEFRIALDMQAAGINLASLQIKPLQAMQKGLESFSDTLADLMTTGKLNSQSFADAFKSMAQSVIKDIISMSLKAYLVKPLMTSMFGGGDMGFGSWMPSISGARERGGAVNAGDSYLVGENGPEVLTAPFSGNIIPNNALNNGSGSNVNLSVNINFSGQVGSNEVNQLKTQLPGIIMNVVRDASSRKLI